MTHEERVELFNRLGSARRLCDAAGLTAAKAALVHAGFASELESHGISIHAIAPASAVRASTYLSNHHPESVEDTMTSTERAELEHLRAFARARADEDPKKKPTLDEIRAMLRKAIADPDEDPADREKARRLLRAIEDNGLDESQKKALASAMPVRDPLAMLDRQVLALRGVRL